MISPTRAGNQKMVMAKGGHHHLPARSSSCISDLHLYQKNSFNAFGTTGTSCRYAEKKLPWSSAVSLT